MQALGGPSAQAAGEDVPGSWVLGIVGSSPRF